MKLSLQNYQPFAKAITRLLHPFAEVVIHDLAKDQIEAIYNPLSRRKVGDHSYLERINFDTSENIIGPYAKTNWDGRPMKSISIVIQNQSGKSDGFLCINMDTSSFESAQNLLQSFLGNNVAIEENSQSLFKDDLYERINLYVQSHCREKQISIEALSKNDKQEIVNALISDGAFEGRNAASYIGRVLGISRSTVYNYLKNEEKS